MSPTEVVLTALPIVAVVAFFFWGFADRIRVWWTGGPEPEMHKTYLSAEAMFADLERSVNSPKWRLYRAIHKDRVRRTRRYVVRFYQRGRYGWSEQDAYNADRHLARVVSGTTGWLAENATGYPEGMTPDQWTAMLKVMSVEFGKYAAHDDESYTVPYGVKQALVKNWGSLWD